ncbi:MAG: PaREP1 family protein [Infirmifilum sp.]
MGVSVTIPRRLYEKVAAMGVDVESWVVDLVLRGLNLDPEDEAEIHLELAEKFLEEGRGLVDEDPAQASEKLYKAAEEAVKAAAYRMGLQDVIGRVRDRGRWTVTELERATRSVSKVLGEGFRVGWDAANYLHVWGFQEARLDSEAVRERLPYIEEMVKVAKRRLSGKP